MINFSRLRKALSALSSLSEDENIQEFLSQVVLGALGVTFVLVSFITFLSWISGMGTFGALVTALVIAGLFLAGFILAKRGHWQIASIIPLVVCFSLGVGGTYLNGLGTPSDLFYVITILLAVIFYRWWITLLTLLSCTLIPLSITLLRFDIEPQIFVLSSAIFTGLLVIIAFLQSFFKRKLWTSLAQAQLLTRQLQVEAALREETLEKLQKSENRFRSIISAVPIGVHIYELNLDDELVLTGANPMAEAILHLDHTGSYGKPIQEAFPGLTTTEFPAIYKAIAKGQQPYKGEELAYEDDRIAGIFDVNAFQSAPGTMVVTFQEITDRIRTQKAILKIAEGISSATGEAFFRSLVINLAQVLGVDFAFVGRLHGEKLDQVDTLAFARDGKIANNFTYKLAGTPCQTVVGQKLCFYPENVQQRFPLDTGLVDLGVQCYLGAPLFSTDGKPLGLIVVMGRHRLSQAVEIEAMLRIFAIRASAEMERDLTQQALVQTESRYRLIFDHAADGIFVHHPDGTILDANKVVLERLGEPREKVIGRLVQEIVSHRYRQYYEERIHRVLNAGSQVYESEHLTKNGGIPVEVSISQVNYDGQQALMAISRDISDRKQHEADIEAAYETTLAGWAQALALRDKETADHSRQVVELTVALAQKLGISECEIPALRRGALLHDIGKVGIPDAILLKPGPLTGAEWEIMRMHPDFAYKLLSTIPYLQNALDIPYCHHERWDGAGYPRGLQGEEIPLAARIFAVVDVWSALTADRPYRMAFPASRAAAYLRAHAGVQFDPAAVAAFLEMMDLIGD